jgi:hypothetical protein
VQVVQESLCLMLMLEADDLVVSKAHDDHVAGRWSGAIFGPTNRTRSAGKRWQGLVRSPPPCRAPT